MYNSAKAAHIMAYLALKTTGRCLAKLKGTKLVYLADREAAKLYGMPMLDEVRFSLPKGPIVQETCDRANPYRSDPDWKKIFADDSLTVKSDITVDDLDELSDADAEILDDIWSRFGQMSGEDLSHWSHQPENIPEWEDPNGSRTPISLERLLQAAGVERPAARAEFIEDHNRIERLFADLAYA